MAVASVGAFNKYADCWTLLTLVVRLTRHFNTKLKSLILDWIWSFPQSGTNTLWSADLEKKALSRSNLIPEYHGITKMSRKILPYYRLFHTID